MSAAATGTDVDAVAGADIAADVDILRHIHQSQLGQRYSERITSGHFETPRSGIKNGAA